MMFTETEHLDIFDNYHLVSLLSEDCILKVSIDLEIESKFVSRMKVKNYSV